LAVYFFDFFPFLCYYIKKTKDLAYATDFCGVRSGKDVDKFAEMKLTKEAASVVSAPMIGESPVNIECKVTEVKELGSHHMFLAEVVAVHVDDAYMNENNKFELGKAEPIAYSHGEYYQLGELLGTFGYSVKKKKHETTKNKKSKT
jgi:flavin reductase (DIM6/NTAB) family NADH-FMN oxidoreductase RutF